MLFGIMPYLMELHFRAEKEKLEEQIADRDRRIKQLEKIVAYDVEEIKILKSRLAVLGGDPDCGLFADVPDRVRAGAERARRELQKSDL